MIPDYKTFESIVMALATARLNNVNPAREGKHKNGRKGMKAKQVAQRRAQEKNRRKVNRSRR